MRHFLPLNWLLWSVTAILISLCSPAAAQFPNKPVQMIVPVPPGGGTDALARQVAKMLARLWGQPIVVDNKGGAAGIIGAQAVMKAPADGYTLLMSHDGVITATSTLFKRPDFDPINQLAPVTQLAILPHVVSVHPSVPAQNMPQLISLIKEKNKTRERFDFATSALGSADHLAGERFKLAAGVDMLIVPYKNTAPAMTDVMAGHVPFGFFALAAALPQVKAGKLKAVAITSPKRSALLPDLPTVNETLPGFETYSWFGLWAPAGTPQDILQKISADVKTIFAMPEMATFLSDNGFEPAISTPREFTEFIRKDADKIQSLIRTAKVSVE